MQPGDTCYVRDGTYRERIIPARGGTSEERRIVYKAYPGETPVIKGSERIATWINESGNVWRTEIADSVFGTFNPYTLNISGPWLDWGTQNHLGEVFLENAPLQEVFSNLSLQLTTMSWYTEHAGTITTIRANFGGSNPNTLLAEITFRESVFFPFLPGLHYITVDGFTMRHAACNWSPPGPGQKGLIGSMEGRYWIIRNCRISDAKCVGIMFGFPAWKSPYDIQSYGRHIIGNNFIERCGEAGIAGQFGHCAGLIEGNLIQDINYDGDFGGAETAGIKFHNTIDLVIKNNIIRRVGRGPFGLGICTGIWIDFANQGIRISGNIIYDMEDSESLLFECNHGPNLMDNNIIIGKPVRIGSERTVFAHNLFVQSAVFPIQSLVNDRPVQYYIPHTLTETGTPAIVASNLGDRYFNNIYIGVGPGTPNTTTDYRSDYNVYYHSAGKTIGDSNSIINSAFPAGFSHVDDSTGVTFSFNADSAPWDVGCPQITRDFIGVYSTVNAGIEDRDGNPITIDRDMVGGLRSALHPVAGPFENLRTGLNTFRMGYAKRPDPIRVELPRMPVEPFVLAVDPNPFHSSTAISFFIEGRQPVTCEVYDLNGKRVRNMGKTDASEYHRMVWTGKDDLGRACAAGLYLVRVTIKKRTVLKTVAFVR